MTSTSAYLAACAAATQPLMRTVFFLATAVVMRGSSLSPVLDVLGREVRKLAQFRRLSSVQTLRNGERGVHPDHACIEVELRHAFETSRRALFDADPTAFAVVDKDLVQAVRPFRPDDARLRADQVTVVAGVARAAAE